MHFYDASAGLAAWDSSGQPVAIVDVASPPPQLPLPGPAAANGAYSWPQTAARDTADLLPPETTGGGLYAALAAMSHEAPPIVIAALAMPPPAGGGPPPSPPASVGYIDVQDPSTVSELPPDHAAPPYVDATGMFTPASSSPGDASCSTREPPRSMECVAASTVAAPADRANSMVQAIVHRGADPPFFIGPAHVPSTVGPADASGLSGAAIWGFDEAPFAGSSFTVLCGGAVVVGPSRCGLGGTMLVLVLTFVAVLASLAPYCGDALSRCLLVLVIASWVASMVCATAVATTDPGAVRRRRPDPRLSSILPSMPATVCMVPLYTLARRPLPCGAAGVVAGLPAAGRPVDRRTWWAHLDFSAAAPPPPPVASPWCQAAWSPVDSAGDRLPVRNEGDGVSEASQNEATPPPRRPAGPNESPPVFTTAASTRGGGADSAVPEGHTAEVLLESYSVPVRYCSRCARFRGPRTFHCDECDACIDGYDHHCPWLGKCVGKHNYPPFFWLLHAVNIYFLATVALVVYLPVFLSRPVSESGGPPPIAAMTSDTAAASRGTPLMDCMALLGYIPIVLTVIGAPVGIAILGLLVAHWALLLKGRTTLEHLRDFYPADNFDERSAATTGGGMPPFFDDVPGAMEWIRPYPVGTVLLENDISIHHDHRSTIVRDVTAADLTGEPPPPPPMPGSSLCSERAGISPGCGRPTFRVVANYRHRQPFRARNSPFSSQLLLKCCATPSALRFHSLEGAHHDGSASSSGRQAHTDARTTWDESDGYRWLLVAWTRHALSRRLTT